MPLVVFFLCSRSNVIFFSLPLDFLFLHFSSLRICLCHYTMKTTKRKVSSCSLLVRVTPVWPFVKKKKEMTATQDDAAKLLTLSSKDLFDFGDLPYTARTLAEVKNFFVRIRTTAKPPLLALEAAQPPAEGGDRSFADVLAGDHIWARIVGVGTMEPYKWQKKNFDLVLELEGYPKKFFPLSAVSHAPPTAEEISLFRSIAAGSGNIPDKDKATQIRALWTTEVKCHQLSPADIAELTAKNEKLRNLTGNVAVINAVRDRENMAIASSIGLMSDADRKRRHPNDSQPQTPQSTGPITYAASVEGQSQVPQSPMGARPSGAFSQLSQLASPLLEQNVTSLFGRASSSLQGADSPAAPAPVSLSLEMLSQVPPAPEVELFAKYITNAERIEKQNRLARLTERNVIENTRSRLAGQAFEKRLQRKAAFMESEGLWYADDAERQRAVDEYLREQDEEAKKEDDKKPSGADKEKKEPRSLEEERRLAQAAADAKLLEASKEAHRRAMDASIPDDLLDEVERRASQLASRESSTLLQRPPSGGDSSPGGPTASPNMMRASSQLLRYSLSLDRKRPRETPEDQ
jgi:hypothetical protein